MKVYWFSDLVMLPFSTDSLSVLASAFAMLINGGLFVFISGLFGIGFSPYAAFQQQKITQTIAMKETNAFFEKELERLRKNNQKLSQNVSEMTSSIDQYVYPMKMNFVCLISNG